MKWEVIYEPILDWLDEQDVATLACLDDSVRLLEEHGPELGRPFVDSVKGSKLHNLKELRPTSPGTSEIRILFVFDKKRRAIFLVAGDKSEGKSIRFRWNRWYKRAVAKAEKAYELFLQGEEGR